MNSDIPADQQERARARVDPLLEALRKETRKLEPQDDSALVYRPDEAPEQ